MRILLFGVVCLLQTITTAFSQKLSVPDVVDKVIGGVVTVAIYQSDVALKPMGFRGNPSDLAYSKVLDLAGAKGSGSGFVIQAKNKYYIITNAHVVQNATDQEGSIYIYSINSTRYEAKIVGGDSFYDLAVLEFTGTPGKEIIPVNFRASETRVGEAVFAIGNPLGDYPYTVSNGIISAKNRIRSGMSGRFGFLQTTATLIWGNSGGPLIDANGEVVGVNSQIAFTEMDGNAMWLPQINFALEAGICKRLFNDIISNNGLIKRAYVGVEINKEYLINENGSYYKSVSNQTAVNQIAVIGHVIPGSPSDGVLNNFLGFKIDLVNGIPIKSVQDVLGVFENIHAGETVTFSLSSGKGQSSTVKVKAGVADAGANSDIGKYALANWGCKMTPSGNHGLSVSFSNSNVNSPSGDNSTGDITVIGKKEKLSSDVLFNGEWMIVGGGVYAETNSKIWIIKDAADLGTVLRLCGENGFIDLVLFKKESDPKNNNNYLAKKFIFSGYDYIIRKSLWY